MKQYKGYYIDRVIFHNEAEVDDFIKAQAVKAYKDACSLFASHSTVEYSLYCDELAEKLVKVHGFTWEQVEELELEAYAA